MLKIPSPKPHSAPLIHYKLSKMTKGLTELVKTIIITTVCKSQLIADAHSIRNVCKHLYNLKKEITIQRCFNYTCITCRTLVASHRTEVYLVY